MAKLRSLFKPLKKLLGIKKSKTDDDENDKKKKHRDRQVRIQSPPTAATGSQPYRDYYLPSHSLYGQGLSSPLNQAKPISQVFNRYHYQPSNPSQSPQQYHSSRSSTPREPPQPLRVINTTPPAVSTPSERRGTHSNQTFVRLHGTSSSPSSSREGTSNYHRHYYDEGFRQAGTRNDLGLEESHKSTAPIPIRITVSAPTGLTPAQRKAQYVCYYDPEELARKPLPPRPGEAVYPSGSLRPSTAPSVHSSLSYSQSPPSTSSTSQTISSQSPQVISLASPQVISLASPSHRSPSLAPVTPVASIPQLPSRTPSRKESLGSRSIPYGHSSPVSLKPSVATVLPTPARTPTPVVLRGESPLSSVRHGPPSDAGLQLSPALEPVAGPSLSRAVSTTRSLSPVFTPAPVLLPAATPNKEIEHLEFEHDQERWAQSSSPAHVRMPSPVVIPTPISVPIPEPAPPTPALQRRPSKPIPPQFPSPQHIPPDPIVPLAAPTSPAAASSQIEIEQFTISRAPTPPTTKQKGRKLSKAKPPQTRRPSKPDLQAATPEPVPIPPVPQTPVPTIPPAPTPVKQTPPQPQRLRKVSHKETPAPAPTPAIKPTPAPAPVAAKPSGSRRPSNAAQRPVIKRNDESAQDNEHYKSLREQARLEGDQMAKAFADSKVAYQAGDGAKAKELSNEGKAHQKEMERLNKEASDWIFKENNRELPKNELDLHGLYVKEAIERAEDAVINAKARGDPRIRIIVGKGLHSIDGVQKIKPAIEDLTAKHRLTTILDPDNAGVLVINLQGQERKARGLDPT
ncbi:hypothetical protein FRC03_009667 [Tulasnella sp. 419]|nr:hypothetical protein FRC03_009667 [Tulasnella sp. 419]